MNAGYGFLGTVIASGVLGYVIDRFFETQPWGLMAMLILGFVYATMRAQKAMNSKDETSDLEKD